MKYLIKNSKVVNEGEVFSADVLIDNGRIAKIVVKDEAAAPVKEVVTVTKASTVKEVVTLTNASPVKEVVTVTNSATVKEVLTATNTGTAPEGVPTDTTVLEDSVAVIDAAGKYLIPGIIDEHVHFRDPGLTHKADIHTESLAAVAGGVTSFMDMPNTVPQTVTNGLLEEKFGIAAEKSLANYSFYLGATNDNLKEVLKVDTGKVCGIKLFMGSSTGGMLVENDKALEALFRESPCLIAAHCEDEQIIRANTEHYRAMAASGISVPDATIHPHIRSAEACLRATQRAVALARRTGARLHVLHISTKEELELFDAKIPLQEKRITAETCPHYLTFTDSHYKDLGYVVKCNPAIKSSADREALIGALTSGKIDTIATDHAPHLLSEKQGADYFTAKSGFPSIQHSLQVMAEIALDGRLSLARLVQLMCHNPALLYGIDKRGFIKEGYHADLAIVDMDCISEISDSQEYTKCGWSPYAGRRVRTKVTHTFVNGKLVYENGVFHDEFRGEPLSFNR